MSELESQPEVIERGFLILSLYHHSLGEINIYSRKKRIPSPENKNKIFPPRAAPRRIANQRFAQLRSAAFSVHPAVTSPHHKIRKE
ncbi:hypothetical protein Mlab_0975 [Methanocorpusculum labreanum Z]|uniref:Uncharacterized protein n=1 Tax=Methanocorpusculum labreanum (strain ATCC 43576 / DSM 4855 / Z) TaxID=410358 RepID=A2SS39_METLZ|nr:hypothetical protein Mlab_0975 [Methanocorpusculum labreanum Z]